MTNHSSRTPFQQDVICTAYGCNADVDERFLPSPLCFRHAEKVFSVFNDTRNWLMQSDVKYNPDPLRRASAATKKQREAQAVVYYVQFGAGVKIGTTTNLKQRLNAFSLPESAVLATEPGSYDLERSRHQFFADTRIPNSEIFTDSPKLRRHIEAVKKYHGEPNITSYLPSA